MIADPDLAEMAEDELARAMTLTWSDLEKVVPWGDTYEGVSPAGRYVKVERSYLWAEGEGGDILCEVAVFPNEVLYDRGARRSSVIRRG